MYVVYWKYLLAPENSADTANYEMKVLSKHYNSGWHFSFKHSFKITNVKNNKKPVVLGVMSPASLKLRL